MDVILDLDALYIRFLFFFSKALRNQLLQTAYSGLFVGTADDHFHGGTLAGGEHHHPHDTFTIDTLVTPLELYVTLELRRQCNKLCGSTGMKPQFVDNGELSGDHRDSQFG